MTLKIAIIGAGPAGCMLARLLQQSKHDIGVTMFEGEGDVDFRAQGGTLDLHEKTGQAALKAGGLFDEFLKYARYDGEALKICDKKLLCYINMGGSKPNSNKIGTGRPEIDRPKLRELLYHSLAEGTVVWKHKLVRVDEDLKLHFSDGGVESGFDLIVGADGAWSKVRPSLTDEQPFYSGIGGHAFRIPDAERTQPELYELVNRGSVFSTSDAKSIMPQYMGEGSINISTWGVRPKDWQKTCGYDVHDAVATKEACRKEFADWDSRLLAFTQVAEDHVVPRDLFMLPVGIRWDHVKGVTLVGDAAHLMVRIRELDVESFHTLAYPSTLCRRPLPAKESISHSKTLCSSPKPSFQPLNRRQAIRKQYSIARWQILNWICFNERKRRNN